MARFALTGGSSLYILLPRSNTVTDLQQVEKKLTDRAVLEMLQKMKTMQPETIEVTLPQIKLDVQPDMYILIKKLGLFIFPFSSVCSACGFNHEVQLSKCFYLSDHNVSDPL